MQRTLVLALVQESFKSDDEKKLHHVALHELGHSLGLDHLDKGVMRSGIFEDVCIDSYALESACDIWACGPNAFPTCD